MRPYNRGGLPLLLWTASARAKARAYLRSYLCGFLVDILSGGVLDSACEDVRSDQVAQ